MTSTLAGLPVAAHGDAAHLTLEAAEGDRCPGEKNFCFKVASGDPGDVAAGADVELTLENPSENGVHHNVHVTDTNAANKGQDTNAAAAFASTGSIDPGESTSVNFTVPEDVDGTYMWCTVGNHEGAGMWILGGAATASGGDGDGAYDGNGSPGFTAAAAIAGLGAALALARRTRD